MEILNNNTGDRSGLYVAAAAAAIIICSIAALAFLARENANLLRYGSSSTTRQASPSPLAHISEKNGMVTISRPGALDKEKAVIDTRLFSGDKIQTSADAGARIQFGGDVSFQLGENALLQIQQDVNDGRVHRPVVELEGGSLRVKGSGIGKLLAGLKTPNALIEFGQSQVITYSRKRDVLSDSYKESTNAADKTSRKYSPELLYIDAVQDYILTASIIEQDQQRIERLLDRAKHSCSKGDSAACSKESGSAWKELASVRLSEESEKDFDVTISIDKSGKERIAVDRGAISVSVASAKISLTEDDKPLELEKDIPVEPVEKSGEELFLNVESIGWN